MNRFLVFCLANLLSVLAATASLEAASLRVSPVLLDLHAPTAASTIRVWNDANQPIHVQIRVFKWTQRNGEDVYETTNEVVASPPITTLRPGAENLIRVVRTSKRPVQGEESYRVIVDELPDPSQRKGGTVNLVVRHSIPVFFASPEAQEASPSWAVERRTGGYLVTLRNSGTRRLKVSNLSLSGGSETVAQREGLVGYALAGSTARWFIPGDAMSGNAVAISANSEAESIHATVHMQ